MTLSQPVHRTAGEKKIYLKLLSFRIGYIATDTKCERKMTDISIKRQINLKESKTSNAFLYKFYFSNIHLSIKIKRQI